MQPAQDDKELPFGMQVGLVVMGVALIALVAHFVVETRMKWRVGGMPFMRSAMPGLGVAPQFASMLSFIKAACANKDYLESGVFACNLAGDLTVVFLDPALLEQVHRGKSLAQLDLLWPKSANLIGQQKVSWKEHRAFVLQLASSASCKAFLPQIMSVFSRHVALMKRDLQSTEYIDAATAVPRAVWSFVLTVVFGPEILSSPKVEKLQRLMTAYGDGFVSVPLNIPGFAFSRSLNARHELTKVFEDEVRARETDDAAQKSASRPDLVQLLINEVRATGGDPCTDVDYQLLINTMFAMTDTTVWASVRIPQCFADHPEVHARVCNEVLAVAGSHKNLPNLPYETLVGQMPYAWAVVDEMLRFYDLAVFNFRTTFEDISITTADGDTFPIPSGARVLGAVNVIARSSPDYVDPDKFLPERFLPPRSEQNCRLRTSNLTFGAGPRLCPGMRLAKTELVVLMTLLSGLGAFKLRERSESIIFEAKILAKPTHGLFFTVTNAA